MTAIAWYDNFAECWPLCVRWNGRDVCIVSRFFGPWRQIGSTSTDERLFHSPLTVDGNDGSHGWPSDGWPTPHWPLVDWPSLVGWPSTSPRPSLTWSIRICGCHAFVVLNGPLQVLGVNGWVDVVVECVAILFSDGEKCSINVIGMRRKEEAAKREKREWENK